MKSIRFAAPVEGNVLPQRTAVATPGSERLEAASCHPTANTHANNVHTVNAHATASHAASSHAGSAHKAKLRAVKVKSAPAETGSAHDEALHVARVNSLGFLASGLSHELLQPLSAIIGFAEGTLRRLRARQADVGDVLYALEEIVSQAQSAGDILNRLRSLVQKRPYAESSLSLAELVEDVLSLHESRMRLQRTHARFEFTADLPSCMGDPVQIKQVLLNLVSNALDAIEERSSGERFLTVRTRLNLDGELETSIADTGRGMTKQQLSKLFTPYFSTKSHGLGVGLTISKTIIEAHGGRLWGQPNSDRGMTFGFTLPVTRQ